jgi:GNAT superfamily N-acetyltransferase
MHLTIKKYGGTIFLAYDDKKVIGCIAGIMEKQSKNNLLECIPTRSGRILELFVVKDYRRHGIGPQFLQKT